MITQTAVQPSGLKKLVLPFGKEGSTMAIRDTIYYGFTNSRESSVFSCETHLTYRLYFSRRNSAELWNLQQGQIRISISLDTPLSWLNYDTPHQMIGATLSLIRNSNRNQWCDICKSRWGQLKDGSWHPLAQSPAIWKAVSQSPKRAGITRFYCQPCADEVQNWPDGTFYALKDQLQDAITKYNKGAYFDEQLA